MCSSVNVTIHGIGAEEVVDFKVSTETTALALKHHIADVHRIAPGCQVLVCRESVIGDGTCVRDLLEDDCDTLSLLLVLSNEELEQAHERLRTCPYGEKLEALAHIGQCFSRGTGDDRTIEIVIAQFEQCGPPCKLPGPSKVQSLAVKILEEIVTKGNDFAVAEVIRRIDAGPDLRVQHVAFLALPSIVERGDKRALAVLYAYLEHGDESVRTRAIGSLVAVAGRGNASAIAAVIQRLSHQEPGVRESAASCLGQIAEKADENATQALRKLMDDPVGCVKRAAVQALATLTANE